MNKHNNRASVQQFELNGNKLLKICVNGLSFNMVYVEAGSYVRGVNIPPRRLIRKNKLQAFFYKILGIKEYEKIRPKPEPWIPLTNNEIQRKIVTPHRVTLTRNFYIGETVVTQDLWWSIMQYNNSKFCYGGSRRPVEMITWNEAQNFINRLNMITGLHFRLPTEAEWEFAARGGRKSKGYKFAGSNSIEEVAWFRNNSNSTTHPVAQLKPNELGLYDMTGNVDEYCQDWFGFFDDKPLIDPKGPSQEQKLLVDYSDHFGPSYSGGHVVKGGCYYKFKTHYDYYKDDVANELNHDYWLDSFDTCMGVAVRSYDVVYCHGSSSIGFRLVLDY